MQRFLLCCLPREQKASIQHEIEKRNYVPVYAHQTNLVKEKSGYRCGLCGKFYPFLQLRYGDTLIDPKPLSKPVGKLQKNRKASQAFFGDHSYALSKKTLLKFEQDAGGTMHQTDAIPLMGDVYHVRLSQTEAYIAAETFRGTITIIDARTKQVIAKKLKCPVNGAFIFAGDSSLLYFFGDAIRCWNFLEQEDRVVWRVPGEWQRSPVVCNTVLYNGTRDAYLFQCTAGSEAYAVAIRELVPAEPVPLPAAPALCRLVYMQAQDRYTLTAGDRVLILDANFDPVGTLAYPSLLRISDGGGLFPVTRHAPGYPHRTFLSPDGSWILLDYFTAVILMKREGHELVHCIFSCTGKTAQHMGFADSRHFWYTWGDSTYIQELPE